MKRLGTLFFLFLVMGLYLLSAIPAAFGWSGSTGGDGIGPQKRQQMEAVQPGETRDTLKPRTPSADIESGDILERQTPSPKIDGIPGESDRIEPGDNFMPKRQR